MYNGDLFNDEYPDLSTDYYTSHLITYLGNKRKLLPFLRNAFSKIQKSENKDKLLILDVFAGSGVVSRLCKTFAIELHTNDIESYTYTINKSYLTNKSDIKDTSELSYYINYLNNNKFKTHDKANHFIETNYAPKDDNNIQMKERTFYTNDNAKIIDNMRAMVEYDIPEQYKIFCLAQLLIKASIHNNTSGIFKGFHKKDGIGHFGGKGENALKRIKQEIHLEQPIFSDYECKIKIYQQDINQLVKSETLPYFDCAYFDPPYNQHPYGSNYFMLNIINNFHPCNIQDGISGIIKDWYRSDYNKKEVAIESMSSLIDDTPSKYILISYNNEGIIPINTFKQLLAKYGTVQLESMPYNTYRGSRNLSSRNIMVNELLWVLRKF